MSENHPIKCLVVDDEPAARDILVRYIDDLSMLHLSGQCANAIQALSFLQTNPVDLLFLDIRMPQLSGTDLVKILKQPPRIIFTTAFPEYALEGYELDAVDYLLKPIRFDRFLKAVQKVMQVQLLPEASQKLHLQPEINMQDSFIYFRADRKMVKVFLKDILYIESMKDYVKVFTKNGLIITKQCLSSLLELLPEKDFVRTHRSFIIALRQVKSFTNELVEIEKAQIPIGRLFRQNLLKALE